MKQLYIIGILVAISLLILLGLNKLGTAPVPTNEESTESATAALEAASGVTDPQEFTNENIPMPEPEQSENATVVMKTNQGDIVIELFTKDAPITAGNFLQLAQADYYDGIKFHRVIDGFMIQGGDPLTKDDSMAARWGTGGPGYAIEDEFIPGLSNVRGTLSMANSGPDTGGSQFFINTVDNTNLDYDKQPLSSKHPVFGRVVQGMDVIDSISKVQTGPGDVPIEPVVIEDILMQ